VPNKKPVAATAVSAMCAFAVCVALGCGGGSSSPSSAGSPQKTAPLAKATLIAKADTICAHYLTELHAHPLKKASEFVQELQRLSTNHQIELSALRKLTPPPALASDWGKIVGGNEALSRDMAVALHEARAGNLRAIAPLLSGGTREQATIIATARQDGFKDCARLR
jgi:hypothetical protein